MQKLSKVSFVHPVTEPADHGTTQSGSDSLALGFSKVSNLECFLQGDVVVVLTRGGIAHRVPLTNVRWYRLAEEPAAQTEPTKPAAPPPTTLPGGGSNVHRR